jgi:hypothetical protein
MKWAPKFLEVGYIRYVNQTETNPMTNYEIAAYLIQAMMLTLSWQAYKKLAK